MPPTIVRHGDRVPTARRCAAPSCRRATPRPRSRSACCPTIRDAIASRTCRPASTGCRSGRRAIRRDPKQRREPHRRPERHARFRPAEGDGALERHLHVAGHEASAGGARQGPVLHPLHGLPRLRVAHGGGGAQRGRLARPRELHARRHGLLRHGPALRLQRPEGRGRDLLHEPRVRRGLGAAEVADRAAATTRTRCVRSATRR